jgi:hypothetical protein
MLYQLSYASSSGLRPPLDEDNTPSDPFLVSGTIFKVTITAFYVQADPAAKGPHHLPARDAAPGLNQPAMINIP